MASDPPAELTDQPPRVIVGRITTTKSHLGGLLCPSPALKTRKALRHEALRDRLEPGSRSTTASASGREKSGLSITLQATASGGACFASFAVA